MKILLVHSFYQYRGGEETYFFSLKELLETKGHKVIIYTKDNKSIKNNLFQKIKIAINLFWNKEVEKELSVLFERHKPDIAHFNNIFPLITPFAYRVCKRSNVPVVQTVHNYRLICPGGFMFKNGRRCIHNNPKLSVFRKLFNNCYKNSYLESFVLSLALLFHRSIKSFELVDLYIFPARFTLQLHKQPLDLPNRKAKFLPYFLDPKKIKPIKFKTQRENNHFLFVGRLSEEKGIIPLLKLFAALPQMKLTVIGDGPLKKEIIKYTDNKNISIKKSLPQNKIFTYMSKALFTIVPSSWFEVLPNVLIESFANGTPVIAPKVGEFKNIIEEWKTGLTFEFNNYGDLKSKLLKVLKYKSRLKSMKASTRKFYEQNYTAERHYSKLLDIYNKMLK